MFARAVARPARVHARTKFWFRRAIISSAVIGALLTGGGGNVNPIWPQRARLSWPHLDETPAGHPSTSCHPLSFGASEAI